MNQDKFVLELSKLNINITELQLKQLERYYELLVEYNKVMNLTGIVEEEDVYLKHFYDSLTIARVIDLKEVNSKTMESKKYKGLYFIGEVLDIDGFCGGFNLQNAWSTAFVAADSISQEV